MNKRTNKLTRKILPILSTVLLISLVCTSVVRAVGNSLLINAKPNLENVRDYVAPATTDTVAYAVDGGLLYAGQPNHWVQRPTPPDVIVAAVTVDPDHSNKVYIGAANELAVYWSEDHGNSWRRVPLTEQYIGGVTDVVLNSAQRTLYVATDTAGIFRLRDVGSSMILSGHTYLDQPVLEIVSDQSGVGLAFARTEWHVYRAVNNGLDWMALDALTSAPTTLAITGDNPATVYVGTVDRGLLKSQDGFTWESVNPGFLQTAGTRLKIDALAVDPTRPTVLYVATSYLFGHTEIHAAPAGVAMSTDNARHWSTLAAAPSAPIVRLLPISGAEGAVYALTTLSRTPQILGTAPGFDVSTVASVNTAIVQTSQLGWVNLFSVWLTIVGGVTLLFVFVARKLRAGAGAGLGLHLPKAVERMVQGV